jgi:hypothetical protein
MAPDFFTVHPVESAAPEEDVLLLDYSFLSTVPEATLRVPTYSRWVERQDQRPAYEYMAKLLRLLLWQRSGLRLVLKSPHHLEFLDTLFDVFPGVKIIWTHRDPCRALASFCSMICHGRGVFSDSVNPGEVGRDWSRKVERMVARAMASRERAAPGTFLDVSYYDLLEDPVAEIARIYDFMGIDLSCRVMAAVERALEENVRFRYGRHIYRLGDFGLNEREVERSFAGYRARFGIRRE